MSRRGGQRRCEIFFFEPGNQFLQSGRSAAESRNSAKAMFPVETIGDFADPVSDANGWELD
jgi:hypothetical protein